MIQFSKIAFWQNVLIFLFQCNHQLDYKDGSLYSVKWYKLDKRGQDMTNFYTYMPNRQNRKQTKHRLQGINVLVSVLAPAELQNKFLEIYFLFENFGSVNSHFLPCENFNFS